MAGQGGKERNRGRVRTTQKSTHTTNQVTRGKTRLTSPRFLFGRAIGAEEKILQREAGERERKRGETTERAGRSNETKKTKTRRKQREKNFVLSCKSQVSRLTRENCAKRRGGHPHTEARGREDKRVHYITVRRGMGWVGVLTARINTKNFSPGSPGFATKKEKHDTIKYTINFFLILRLHLALKNKNDH